MNSPGVSLAQDRQYPAPPTIPVWKATAFRSCAQSELGNAPMTFSASKGGTELPIWA
jgi:hypothetical protein